VRSYFDEDLGGGGPPRSTSAELSCGWRLEVRRFGRSHNPKVAGSNPAPGWTLVTLGLFTGTAVLWRGGSTHDRRLEISGVVLLMAAVVIGAYFG
jgi:hypothetical protein